MVLAAFQYDRHRTVSEKSWEVYYSFHNQPEFTDCPNKIWWLDFMGD